MGKNSVQSENIRVGNLIRRAREHRDLTMEELAKRCGIQQPSLSRYESGAQVPSSKQLDRIADGLGCSRCTICPHHYKHEDS